MQRGSSVAGMRKDWGSFAPPWRCGSSLRRTRQSCDRLLTVRHESLLTDGFVCIENGFALCLNAYVPTHHPPARIVTSTSPTDDSAIARKKIGVYLYLIYTKTSVRVFHFIRWNSVREKKIAVMLSTPLTLSQASRNLNTRYGWQPRQQLQRCMQRIREKNCTCFFAPPSRTIANLFRGGTLHVLCAILYFCLYALFQSGLSRSLARRRPEVEFVSWMQENVTCQKW